MNGINADTFDAETYTSKNTKKTTSSKKMQNPIQSYVGTYGCGRATMKVSELGTDQATVTVYWSSSAFEHSEWTMSGKVSVKNGCVVLKYNDCIKNTIVYGMDGEFESDTVEYAFGSGTITFCGDYADWYDAQENVAECSIFEFAG
jgi:hypothetical protein